MLVVVSDSGKDFFDMLGATYRQAFDKMFQTENLFHHLYIDYIYINICSIQIDVRALSMTYREFCFIGVQNRGNIKIHIHIYTHTYMRKWYIFRS